MTLQQYAILIFTAIIGPFTGFVAGEYVGREKAAKIIERFASFNEEASASDKLNHDFWKATGHVYRNIAAYIRGQR
jgi:hypothetical protein